MDFEAKKPIRKKKPRVFRIIRVPQGTNVRTGRYERKSTNILGLKMIFKSFLRKKEIPLESGGQSFYPHQNKKGQALVEYVLILTVIVFVFTVLMLKFMGKDQGIHTWANSIVGTDGYIACLLQTATLPYRPHPDCWVDRIQANFSTTTPTPSSSGASPTPSSSGASPTPSSSGASPTPSSSGASPTPSSSGASSSTGGGGGGGENSGESENSDYGENNTNNNSNNNKKGKKGKSSSSGRSYSPEGDLISLNSSSESLLDENKNSEKGGGGAGGRRRKKKKKGIGFRDNLSSSNSQPGYSGQRFKAVASYGYMDEEREEKEKRNTPIAFSSTGAKKKKPFNEKEKKSRFIIKKKQKKTSQDVKIGKWSFGNIFRVVLIILVIAVLVFLIASQTTTVKKSMK